MADFSLTLREKIGLRDGDIKISSQIRKRMCIESIWRCVEAFFLSWLTEFKKDISVTVSFDEMEGFKVELKSENRCLTSSVFFIDQIYEMNQDEIDKLMRTIVSKAISEGMKAKMKSFKDKKLEIQIWYQT